MSTNEKHLELINSYRQEKCYYLSYHRGLRFLLEPFGLSILEMDLLFCLYHNPDCDTVTKMCADIEKTKGVVSRSCEHLYRENYFSETTDERDRRITHFKLTATARPLISTIARFFEAMNYKKKIFGFLWSDCKFVIPVESLTKELGIACTTLALVDTKKALVFPIKDNVMPTYNKEHLPFCSYSQYLDQIVPAISAPEEEKEVREELSLLKIQDELNETGTISNRMLPSAILQGDMTYALTAEPFKTNNELLLMMINKQQKKK